MISLFYYADHNMNQIRSSKQNIPYLGKKCHLFYNSVDSHKLMTTWTKIGALYELIILWHVHILYSHIWQYKIEWSQWHGKVISDNYKINILWMFTKSGYVC